MVWIGGLGSQPAPEGTPPPLIICENPSATQKYVCFPLGPFKHCMMTVDRVSLRLRGGRGQKEGGVFTSQSLFSSSQLVAPLFSPSFAPLFPPFWSPLFIRMRSRSNCTLPCAVRIHGCRWDTFCILLIVIEWEIPT